MVEAEFERTEKQSKHAAFNPVADFASRELTQPGQFGHAAPAVAQTRKKLATSDTPTAALAGYETCFADIVQPIENARREAARAVNTVMTATYWLVGPRVVEQEQNGRARAKYGKPLMASLAVDLTSRFGRGFGQRNLLQMRALDLTYPAILQTASAEFAPSANETLSLTLPAKFAKTATVLATRLRIVRAAPTAG